jgi:hypothetical protein
MSQAVRVFAAIRGVGGDSELRLGWRQNLAIGNFGADTVSSL